MLFNSYIFVLCFLPLSVIGYFVLNRFGKTLAAKLYLVIASLVFYGYNNYKYILLIVLSVLVNYAIYQCLSKFEKKKKLIMTLGVIFNLGLLFYFKYLNFFLDNVNAILKTDLVYKEILLPLGISFFTFQQIGFIVDAYKGEVKKVSFIDYCAFVTFFPQLVAGPIVSHEEIIPQLQDEKKKQVNWENIAKGLWAFAMGLGKKVLVADVFGEVVNAGFKWLDTLGTISVLLVMLSYTLQIYFDFSGYCDMASGIALMLNIELPVNFDSPYKAFTLGEFWKRWHITLTRFLTKYVYIPLGGNRKGKIRTCINVLIVFMLSGLWHGASWTFVIWGLMHGTVMVLERICKPTIEKLHNGFTWLVTFAFINISWVVFKVESLSQLKLYISRLLSLKFSAEELLNIGEPFNNSLVKLCGYYGINSIKVGFIVAALYYVVALFAVFNTKNIQEQSQVFKVSVPKAIIMVIVMLLSVMAFSSVSTFLYFNF